VRSVQARPLTRCGYRHAGHQGCSGAVNNRTRLGSYPPGFRPSSFVTNGPSKYEPCTTPARGKRHAPTGAADSRACTRLLRLRGPISEARVCACALVRALHWCVQGTSVCRALVRAGHWCVQCTGACRALVRAGHWCVQGRRHLPSVEGGTSARCLRFGCMEALPEPADQAGLRVKAHAAIGARVAQSGDSLLLERRSLTA
jgi:hypothetical protein